MAKIGVGIITCNRPDYFKALWKTLPLNRIDDIVVVNDGKPIDVILEKGEWIDNPINLGSGKTKTKAMKYLVAKGCEHIFIIEDDMLILNPDIFDKYIEASLVSGIKHFNYGPGSPFNRKQKIQFDLHNRHLLDQHSPVNPKFIIDYGKGVKIALYEHTVAMFSYYSKEVLEKVGYIDERFESAFDHVDHTYRIHKAGYHPHFWHFADIADSEKYLTEAPDAIKNSVIAKNEEEWMKKVRKGAEIYQSIHGHVPNNPPLASKQEVLDFIKKLKPKNL